MPIMPTIQGLLSPEGQPQGLTGLLENPLFNVGMGLMAHRFDRGINPAQATIAGLAGAREERLQREERERMDKLREQMSEFFQRQQAQPFAQPQLPGMSPMPGYGMPQMSPTAAAFQQPTPDPRVMQMLYGPGYAGTPGIMPGVGG